VVDPDVAVDATGTAALDTVASYRQLAAATIRAAERAGRASSAQAAQCLAALEGRRP
jgi:hypothetical protein